ncbi:ABC transporter ATP-binding protein [Kolteria novifilia]
MNAVVFDQIGKTFDGKRAVLDQFSLEIAPGEHLVIVGPSGSGKSTLLRLLAGLEQPTSGRLLLRGRDAAGIPPRERELAMMFEEPALLPGTSVRHNLRLGASLHAGINSARLFWDRWSNSSQDLRAENAVIERSVAEAAETLGLEHLLDRRVDELSAGERQRTALGRAIVRGADLLLLDEPTGKLDPPRRAELRDYLRRLIADRGMTLVHVTHDHAEAMALATRLAVVDEGRLLQVGPPEEVYDSPSARFVAEFIGDPPMRFFLGRLERLENRWNLTSDDGIFSLQWDCTGDVLGHLPLEVTVGVRPEQVHLRTTDGDVGGHVVRRRSRGSDLLLEIAAGSQRLSAIEPRHCPIHVGDHVELRLGAWSVFETTSGRALLHHRRQFASMSGSASFS